MTTYKTNELTGDLLNQAVAKAIGLESIWVTVGTLDEPCDPAIDDFSAFNPVADWAQCGELIEWFNVEIQKHHESWGVVIIEKTSVSKCYDNDLKTAICRCVVQSVLGDEVDRYSHNPLIHPVQSVLGDEVGL